MIDLGNFEEIAINNISVLQAKEVAQAKIMETKVRIELEKQKAEDKNQ